MKKLKIFEISSNEYPGGRIDKISFKIDRFNLHGDYLIPLFMDLDFSKESMNDIDIEFVDYKESEEIIDFFFYGNPKVKAYFLAGRGIIKILFDTTIPREELNEVLNKYFEFP
jgi:hypothetical protein